MAKIGKMINDITGSSDEETRTKEQLSFLLKMAKAKSETFENRLKLMLSNKESVGTLEIVGDKALEYRNGQHANISNSCDEAIASAIDEFFRGSSSVKAGFQKIVKQGLSRLIGNTSIGEAEDTMSFVYPENYSIVRVDVMAYKYTFSSKGVLANNVENVFVYTMAKSIVDHKKVGVDFLMHSVVDMLRGDSEEDPDLEDVMPFIQNLRLCWSLLDEDAVSISKSNLLKGVAPKVDTAAKARIQRKVAKLTPDDVLASAEEGNN